MNEPKTQSDPIHLNEAEDAERRVIIRPENDDVFVRTGKQVIAACCLGISVELWLEELQAMVEEVGRWAAKNERVRACYCAPSGSRVVFYFAPKKREFDFDLADMLAELNMELLQKFNIGMVELHQVPWDEMDRFLSAETAKRVYGEKLEAPETMAS